ncbi:MAG: carboxymuconolactone decarboxylase family protein [Candidatus Azotimanducaceae bacterium WSBS_2022_MAG_OTU7]
MGEKEAAALQLTDDIIGVPGHLRPSQVATLKKHYSDAEIAELALGVGLFMGMSKVLITLGLEPEEMDTTLLPTPGS